MGTSGFPLFGVTLAGSRPGRRPTSLRRQRSRQERRPRFTGHRLRRRLPCAARIGRPAQNSPAARAQTAAPEGPARCCAARRLRRGFSESPRVACRAWVIDGKAEASVDSLITKGVPVKARCWVKAPSEPLSSGATGGEVRRSCLSGRSPRVLRRPPVVSSARQSSDQAQLEQTTGSAGSPFLLTSLATQRSKPAAGPGPGQCDVKQRKTVGPHQRPQSRRVRPTPAPYDNHLFRRR